MKVVFAESPARKDRDYSIEKAMCPPGTQFQFAIFDPKAEDNSQFYRDIADADVVIDVYTYFGRKEIDAMKHCKCISFQSSGYSLADLDYAAQKGIAVASVVDYCKEEVSTHAIALMLALQRGSGSTPHHPGEKDMEHPDIPGCDAAGDTDAGGYWPGAYWPAHGQKGHGAGDEGHCL